jgi:hypothetical protein
MESVGIFYCHCVYIVAAWYILLSFGIFSIFTMVLQWFSVHRLLYLESKSPIFCRKYI